jgi:hypothetical protein
LYQPPDRQIRFKVVTGTKRVASLLHSLFTDPSIVLEVEDLQNLYVNIELRPIILRNIYANAKSYNDVELTSRPLVPKYLNSIELPYSIYGDFTLTTPTALVYHIGHTEFNITPINFNVNCLANTSHLWTLYDWFVHYHILVKAVVNMNSVFQQFNFLVKEPADMMDKHLFRGKNLKDVVRARLSKKDLLFLISNANVTEERNALGYTVCTFSCLSRVQYYPFGVRTSSICEDVSFNVEVQVSDNYEEPTGKRNHFWYEVSRLTANNDSIFD